MGGGHLKRKVGSLEETREKKMNFCFDFFHNVKSINYSFVNYPFYRVSFSWSENELGQYDAALFSLSSNFIVLYAAATNSEQKKVLSDFS